MTQQSPPLSNVNKNRIFLARSSETSVLRARRQQQQIFEGRWGGKAGARRPTPSPWTAGSLITQLADRRLVQARSTQQRGAPRCAAAGQRSLGDAAAAWRLAYDLMRPETRAAFARIRTRVGRVARLCARPLGTCTRGQNSCGHNMQCHFKTLFSTLCSATVYDPHLVD